MLACATVLAVVAPAMVAVGGRPGAISLGTRPRAHATTVLPKPSHRRTLGVVAVLTPSSPSQEELEVQGVRDWPQTSNRGPFEDVCEAGALRYVLQGSGTVRARMGDAPAPEDPEVSVDIGTMLEVSEPCTLVWMPDNKLGFVLLTPEYKGPPLLAVGAAFFVLFGGLIAGVVGGGGGGG